MELDTLIINELLINNLLSKTTANNFTFQIP